MSGATAEFYGGVRKSFGSGSVRPLFGAGLSAIAAAVDVSGVGDDDDSSLAGYVHGGVGIDLGESLTAGIDVRLLFGSDLEIAGVSTDADYGQVALFFGINL
ncbi:MAG: hypothetical protein EXS08_09190 [Planctomycetes bacterium]|nr:hypothetical protein [Planctomycetota bacterium]